MILFDFTFLVDVMEIYIPLSFLTIFVGIELILLLFYKYYSYRKSAPISSKIFLAFASFITGTILGKASITLQQFYIEKLSLWFIYFYSQSWFFIELGLLGTCFIIEKEYKKTFNTSYFFTTFTGIGLLFSIFNWIHPIIRTLVLIIYTFTIVFVSIFYYFLITRSKGENKKRLNYNFIGFLFYTHNFIITTNTLCDLFQEANILIFSYVIQFLGILLLFVSFYTIPVINDLDWRENIQEIYILSLEKKKTIYYHNFKNAQLKAKEIYAGGIIGVESIIQNISQTSEPIRVIEDEQETLIIEHCHELLGVFTVQNRFRIHHKILQEILRKFHTHYDYILHCCDMDFENTNLFDGFDQIMQEIIFK